MSVFFKICVIIVLLSPLVQAQENAKVRFELSPHTGFMDGSGQFGLDASMNYKAFNLEFSAAQVIGETADLYPLNVNLLFNFAQKGKMIPYGGVGVGLLLTVPSTTIGNKTLSSLGLNFGGGLRFYLTDDFGLRLGVNQFLTNIKSKRDESGELLIFQEVTVGVVFVFN